MEFLFVCCKLLKRGPRLQNLAWISTSQRAELIDSVVIVQVLSQSQLQNWHVVPASDFDYFWTMSCMCLELGFHIMALLSNILQMLSSEGGSTFQGAQTLKTKLFFSVVVHDQDLSSAECCWQVGRSCLQPTAGAPPLREQPHTHLGPPLPLPLCKAWAIKTKFYTGIPRIQTASIMCLMANMPMGSWTSLCNPTTEPNASSLGTNAQPCHASSCQPCSRSWALTRDFPS